MRKWKVRGGASDYILSLLVYSVMTVMLMRLWFKIIGKIQITFGVWHIAHVLWGGLLMLVAILMMIVFDGKQAKAKAVVFAGVGWGLFIDEVGKFLTRDNNYWFQPAVIFIYASFILLFLVYRVLENWQTKMGKAKSSVWERRLATAVNLSYNKIFRKRIFVLGLAGYSVFYAMDKIYDGMNIFKNYDGLMMTLKIVSESSVGIMFLIGIALIVRRKTTLGLKFYKNGLLVSILLVSVFRFYFEQFSAVFGLILDILVYSWISSYYVEKKEKD